MSKKAVYFYRIDDPVTLAITRGQTDAPVLVDQDGILVCKICIVNADIKLESYDEKTDISTPIIGNIDRAYVVSRVFNHQNYI